MRTYYTDFVSHCMRFYARHRDPKFHSEADKKNWHACDSAIKSFSDKEIQMLIDVYSDGDTIPDNVYQTSKRYEVKQDAIWKLIGDLEHKVAKRRGLI